MESRGAGGPRPCPPEPWACTKPGRCREREGGEDSGLAPGWGRLSHVSPALVPACSGIGPAWARGGPALTGCRPGLSLRGARLTQTQRPRQEGPGSRSGAAGGVDGLVLRAGWRPQRRHLQRPDRGCPGALRPVLIHKAQRRPRVRRELGEEECGVGGVRGGGGCLPKMGISERLPSTDHGLADCSTSPGVPRDPHPHPAPASQPW